MCEKNLDMKKNKPLVNGWGCMYYLPSLRRGTVKEKSPAFWGSREKQGEGILGLKRWTKNFPSSSERGDICMESRGCNKIE
jgi:hypothetical protein